MKSIKSLLLLMFTLTGIFFAGVGCEKESDQKTYVDIPDDGFLSALLQEGVDTNGDNKISREEAEDVSSLYINGYPMQSLEGIEAFINLDTLVCYESGISDLDISKNTALVFLSCGINEISTLDVSNNTRLKFLSVYDNLLTSLDVSNNTALTRLDCNRNQLSTLDVNSNTALTELAIADNQLTSLSVSENVNLLNLNVSGNQLTNLDVSSNTSLTKLWCVENQLKSLDVSGNTNLNELDIRKMPSLEQVCVWTMPFPPAGVDVYTTDSPNVYFTNECGM